jgi:tRNA-dihydrouridine synthase 1
MMNSELFAGDSTYREKEFQTVPSDRPLVAHFSGNNPQILLEAARLVQDQCDAIDINLGCPQRIAHAGHFGSYLLGDEDRALVVDMVRTLSSGLRVPVCVKVRLLDTVSDTIELCRQLHEAGASLIAVHARYRVNLVGRTGAGARDGPAHLDQVREVKQALPNATIIANGNIVTYSDAVTNLETTEADGVMSAEVLINA